MKDTNPFPHSEVCIIGSELYSVNVCFRGDLHDNCVHAFTASSYKWRISTCGTENKYVCEKPQGKIPIVFCDNHPNVIYMALLPFTKKLSYANRAWIKIMAQHPTENKYSV